ncbi:hypothetical protein L7F22_026161 [Adiantum nelumboides]|nr:hypothetical protein [Adiantum nelumboides]
MASNCILPQGYDNYTYKKLEAHYRHEHTDKFSAMPLVEIGVVFGGKGFALSGEVLEAELSKICGSILSLLDSHMISSTNGSELEAFYLKMKGDYQRYFQSS